MTVLTSSVLDSLNREHHWLEHGFGTRTAKLDQSSMASLKQIHSDRSLLANEPGSIGEGDALMTQLPGLSVSVRTADCFPILLADPETHAVAAIHAGWRGTAAGIARSTLARMQGEFGTIPKNVRAAIGPGIGACCYEVGVDVARQFGIGLIGSHLDLAAENRSQLIAAGLDPANIDVVGGCTSCNPAQFFSWRRDRDPNGRMISFIRTL